MTWKRKQKYFPYIFAPSLVPAPLHSVSNIKLYFLKRGWGWGLLFLASPHKTFPGVNNPRIKPASSNWGVRRRTLQLQRSRLHRVWRCLFTCKLNTSFFLHSSHFLSNTFSVCNLFLVFGGRIEHYDCQSKWLLSVYVWSACIKLKL